MIQRIQSIWLLLASIASFATLKYSFYSGNLLDVANAKNYKALTGLDSGILIIITTIATAILSLVCIFFYSDRKKQIQVATAALILQLFTIGLYFGKSTHFLPNEGKLDLTSVISFAVPVLLTLAIRAIWKDEQMVKNADRLR
jgi:uncharacterized membrane protein